MTHEHLKKVFAKCTLITELLFSIEEAQSWVPKDFIHSFVGKFPNGRCSGADGRTWEVLLKESFELTELKGSRTTFSRLVNLDLYMSPNILFLANILRCYFDLMSFNIACVTFMNFSAEPVIVYRVLGVTLYLKNNLSRSRADSVA